MNKNIKKVVAATVVAGLAVAPVAAQTTAPVAQAAEQAQSKHVAAKFVQNEKGNFVQVTATQDVQAAKVTISVDGKGQYTVNVGDLKKGETKLVPFNVDAKVGNGFAPKALPKTAAVTEHVTISKTINSHLVRATVSYKYDDGKAGSKDKVVTDKDPKPPVNFKDLVGGGNAPADKPTEPGNAAPAPSDKPGDVAPAPAPTEPPVVKPLPGIYPAPTPTPAPGKSGNKSDGKLSDDLNPVSPPPGLFN